MGQRGSASDDGDDDIVSGRKYLLNKTVNCAAVAVFYIIHGIVAECQRLLLLHMTSKRSVAGGEGNPLPEGLPRGGHYTDGHYWFGIGVTHAERKEVMCSCNLQ